ncbi:SAM-dependent methyltransferase [Streptomyces phaeoluteigriseus]
MVPATVPRMTDASAFLTATRTFYDAIAEDYADRFRDLHARLPWDRAVFALYAELVGVGGKVADLGCGPGRVTGHLASLGLSMSGLDLSESMLAVARRENPGIPFERGSMLELGHGDGSLDGVVSWYSSIHTPADRPPPSLRGVPARPQARRPRPPRLPGRRRAQAPRTAVGPPGVPGLPPAHTGGDGRVAHRSRFLRTFPDGPRTGTRTRREGAAGLPGGPRPGCVRGVAEVTGVFRLP